MHALLLAASDGTPRFVDLDIHVWEWAALLGFITFLLIFDLLVVHRKPHEIQFKEAAIESAIWISIGLAFTGVIYYIGKTSGIVDGVHGQDVGAKAAGEYISGFLLEKSLSIDNVFVWAVIFSYFAVPPKYQFRTLFWGIFGALVLRAIFIMAGSALIEAFTATLLVFGLILIYTAQKIAFHDDHEIDPDTSIVLRAVRRLVPSTNEYDGQKLFTKQNGRRLATPLFAVLVMVESTDVVFAIDSVPAIFGVANETFIVFSSNAFAILGLRALFFCLNGMQDRFRYLNYGLGAILAFVGVKMILTFTGDTFDFPTEHFHFPTWLSLTVIVVILTLTIVLSLRAESAEGDGDGDQPGDGGPGGPAAVAAGAAPSVGAEGQTSRGEADPTGPDRTG